VYTYLLINLFILVGPFALSFVTSVNYKAKWGRVLLASLPVAVLFIIWDSFASSRGDWAFSESRTLPFRIASLPFEELLFFFTVPFSCLFIYESLSHFKKDTYFQWKPWYSAVLSVIAFVIAILYRSQYYTMTVFLFIALYFLYTTFGSQKILGTRNFWLYLALSYIPFVLFNYLLTSIPVVTYSSDAIWGGRFLTIPFEDFFYNFILLVLYLEAYLWIKHFDLERSNDTIAS
jgi:lycopene cyclase domain-containing protein